MHLNISFKHITKVFVDYKLNFVQYEINDYFCLVMFLFFLQNETKSEEICDHESLCPRETVKLVLLDFRQIELAMHRALTVLISHLPLQ